MKRRKAIRNTGVLAGATLMLPSLITLLNSCKSETRLDWQPLFFSNQEAEIISTLVDLLLPRTDTPGALDVKVDLFLDKVFAKTYDQEGQQKMKSDIYAFDKDCQSIFGRGFLELNDKDKNSFIEISESDSGKFNGSVWGTAVGKQEPVGFYRTIKSMAIWAYMSSEEIGKNVLNYDPVPKEFKGCLPLADIGNRWTE